MGSIAVRSGAPSSRRWKVTRISRLHLAVGWAPGYSGPLANELSCGAALASRSNP